MFAQESSSERTRPVSPYDVYAGSDAAATKALYTKLEICGPVGVVAMNLFKAQKASARAKEYQGGIRGKSFSRMSYDRKAEALGNLCHILMQHWRELRLIWGWKRDPREGYATWVLYVELPQGQVSFHNTQRLTGPEYFGDWDKQYKSAERIMEFCSEVLRVHNKTPMLF
jgi:hypothetical protein